MTDAPALSPGGAAADLMPTAADHARAELEALKNDPEWVKKHLAGSHETQAKVRELAEKMHTPAPGSVISGAPSLDQQAVQTADHLAETTDYSPEIIDHVRYRRPISSEEYRMSVGRYETRMSDPDFRARLGRGESTAKREMGLIEINLSSPVKVGT